MKAAITALCSAVAAPLLAQGGWVTPQPPCEISAAHFKVNGGVLHLKAAAEKPDQRTGQLAEARRVLVEAILQDKQDKNPGAWYYLGRYYFETGDAAGADSALARALALAPQCKQDIDGYRRRLWATTLNAGLAAWQGGKEESAVALFGLAARLAPANPKAFVALAGLYAGKENYDSALVYYRRTAEAAGTDTAFAKDKREALGNAARILVGRAQTDAAAQHYARLRASVDSIDRGLESDSTILARLTASSQSRKARGRRLSPADQQTFTRDSSGRAQAVAQARVARVALLQQMAADSGKLQAAFAPAISALQDYLAAYPGELDAATSLATLYAQSGRAAAAAAVFDSVAARAQSFDPEELFTAGQRLMSQRWYRAGARALAVAQRLVQLDPLNRSSIKLLAAAWDLRGRRDSTLRYLAQADSLLAVEVTVSSFVPDSGGAAVTLLATNLRPAPSKPFRLTVEFLDPQGKPVASETRDVPAILPQENQQIDLKVSGKGIAGWRYRPS